VWENGNGKYRRKWGQEMGMRIVKKRREGERGKGVGGNLAQRSFLKVGAYLVLLLCSSAPDAAQ